MSRGPFPSEPESDFKGYHSDDVDSDSSAGSTCLAEISASTAQKGSEHLSEGTGQFRTPCPPAFAENGVHRASWGHEWDVVHWCDIAHAGAAPCPAPIRRSDMTLLPDRHRSLAGPMFKYNFVAGESAALTAQRQFHLPVLVPPTFLDVEPSIAVAPASVREESTVKPRRRRLGLIAVPKRLFELETRPFGDLSQVANASPVSLTSPVPPELCGEKMVVIVASWRKGAIDYANDLLKKPPVLEGCDWQAAVAVLSASVVEAGAGCHPSASSASLSADRYRFCVRQLMSCASEDDTVEEWDIKSLFHRCLPLGEGNDPHGLLLPFSAGEPKPSGIAVGNAEGIDDRLLREGRDQTDEGWDSEFDGVNSVVPTGAASIVSAGTPSCGLSAACESDLVSSTLSDVAAPSPELLARWSGHVWRKPSLLRIDLDNVSAPSFVGDTVVSRKGVDSIVTTFPHHGMVGCRWGDRRCPPGNAEGSVFWLGVRKAEVRDVEVEARTTELEVRKAEIRKGRSGGRPLHLVGGICRVVQRTENLRLPVFLTKFRWVPQHRHKGAPPNPTPRYWMGVPARLFGDECPFSDRDFTCGRRLRDAKGATPIVPRQPEQPLERFAVGGHEMVLIPAVFYPATNAEGMREALIAQSADVPDVPCTDLPGALAIAILMFTMNDRPVSAGGRICKTKVSSLNHPSLDRQSFLTQWDAMFDRDLLVPTSSSYIKSPQVNPLCPPLSRLPFVDNPTQPIESIWGLRERVVTELGERKARGERRDLVPPLQSLTVRYSTVAEAAEAVRSQLPYARRRTAGSSEPGQNI